MLPRVRRLVCLLAVALVACDEEEPYQDLGGPIALAGAGADAGAPVEKAKKRPRSIVLAEAREDAAWRVADGFLSREDLVETVMGVLEVRESLRGDVERLVDELLEEHRQRERTWKHLTDPDRLDLAFEALEKQRILARQRLADCQTCALAELEEEWDRLAEDGRTPRGYVFFTDQDAEGLADDKALYLAYGAVGLDDAAQVRVGERIVAALKKAGLQVAWDGDLEKRIAVVDLDWQKRRFTRRPRR